MLVFDFAEYLTEMYKVPELARALRYPITRVPGDGDVWDGKLLSQWTDEMKMNILPLAFSSDATVLQAWKERSFTPCVVQILSLPPHIRQSSIGYALLALFPPKVRIYVCVCVRMGTLCMYDFL